MKLQEEKLHENNPLFCDNCGKTLDANNTKVDIKKAAKEMAELVQEMKEEIPEHTTQMEKTTEMLEKNVEKIAAARNKVLTTVEEIIRVLKKHEISIVTKLDAMEIQQQRDHATQLEQFRNSATRLETSLEQWERISQGNNRVEILKAQRGVIEGCKGLLNAKEMNIYKPLDVNEEDIQNVAHAFLDEDVVVKVSIPSEQDLDTNIGDNEDGKYSITNAAECDGNHDVVIEVNGQTPTSSPKSVHVNRHRYHALHSFGTQGETPGKFHLPRDIAIDSKTGNIAVADAHNKRVQLFSSDGTYLKQYEAAKTLSHPISVAFNSAGDVTILDGYRNIFCFTENGESIKVIPQYCIAHPNCERFSRH